jgi:superfamily II DNA/RNA helicase
LLFLDKLLPKLREGNHKVLIFSQMVRVLDILAHYLSLRGHKFERLDGGVRGNDRQSAIDRFCKPDSDIFVFLLCTRAGGVGINLAAADTVIIFDSDWNPQNDIQAQARAHRIGQTSEVKVYRLLTAKTYERGMFERASRKLGLDQAVLSNLGVSSDPTKALDDKEIDMLLKYGAYELFRTDTDKETDDLDLEKILEKSKKFVWNNPEAASGNSTFSTAHFQGDKDESGVDLAAPNFWEKILPDTKSLKSLEKALENAAAALVQNPSEKAKFMSTLESRVTDFLREWQEGQGDHEDAEGLVRILGISRQQHLDRAGGIFSQEEYEKLGSWLEEVSHPRRKRRLAASNAAAVFTAVGAAIAHVETFPGAEHEAFTGTGETEEEDTTYGRGVRVSDNTTSTSAAVAARNQWTRVERIAFHEAFMACPDSRWDHMQGPGSNNALLGKTLEEIYQYARRFLQSCIQLCDEVDEKEDKNVFQDTLDGIFPPSRDLVDLEIARNGGVDRTSITKPSMSSDATYKRLMPKKLKTWARRLRHLATLRNVILTAAAYFSAPVEPESVPALQTAEELYQFTIQKIESVPLLYPTRPLAKWWTRQEDRNLLLGTFKHGFGRYEPMLHDNQLSFHQYLPRIHAANAVTLTAVAQQKHKPDIKQEQLHASSELSYEPAMKLDPEESPQEMKSTQHEVSSQLKSPLTPLLPEELFKVISLSTEAIDPAMALEESQLQLRFRLQHLRSHLSDQFPDSRILDSHVKWLLDQIRGSFRAGDRDGSRRKNRTVAAANKEEPKKQKPFEQKKVEKLKLWTKKEEKELRAAIMMFGGGYWEVLRIQAGLDTKTEDQVKEYFFNLMALCRQVCHQAQGRSSGDADGDDMDDGAPFTKRESTPLDSVISWPSDPNDLLSGGNMMIHGSNQPALVLTPTMARRYLRRVGLFQDIRTKVLLHGYLHERLAEARFSDVPPWWVPVVTDVALLESVIKYGIGGPQQWEEFLKDPECPLFAIEADGRRTVVPIETQELKRGFFHDFLIDKSPLVSRLEMLVQTVLQRQPTPAPVSFPHSVYVKEEYGSASSHIAATAAAAAAAAATAASSSGRVNTRANGKRKHYDGEYGAPDAKRSKNSVDEEAPSGKLTTRPVPRDDDGTVVLPITAKGATIVSLGNIVHDRPKYHARSYIWPVGFKSTRKMPSIKNPQQQVIYTSEIVDNGDGPGFRVTPADAPELSMTFGTASRVWMEMLRKIKRRQSISVSGPETYGYSDPTVRMLIQELDGAELCESYQWVNFDGSWTKEDKIARAAGRPFSAPQHPPSSKRKSSSAGRKRPRGNEQTRSSFETDEVDAEDSDDGNEVDVVSPEPPRPTGKFPVPSGPTSARHVAQKQPKAVVRQQDKMAMATDRNDAEQQLRELNDRLAKIQQRQELLKSAQSAGSMIAGNPHTGSGIRRVSKPLQSFAAPTHGLHLSLDAEDHGLSPIDGMELESHDSHNAMHKSHRHDVAMSVASDGSMTPIDHLGDIDPLPSDLGEEEMQMMIENME